MRAAPGTGAALTGADREALGVDIGGSGIKGARVDLATGALIGDRFRHKTPQPSTPDSVVDTVAAVLAHLQWQGPLGCTFPGVVKAGRVLTAANVDPSWVDTDAAALLGARTGDRVTVANDADAAGVAEARYGAAAGVRGVVLLLTLGTGIGSALLLDGILVPNSELGHLEVDGEEAEARASDAAREREDLSWHRWSRRLSAVLARYEALLWPDLIILGGGVIKQQEHWLPLLECRTRVVPAALANTAGIVGAALLDAEAGQNRP